ncbi:MAG TPA: RNA polymerase sigma factor [Polyangiaceae bacterium]|nr:RNA polymerase sigma factor [Polyangiaceae bacterium]
MTDSSLPSVRQVFDEHGRYVWRALRHLGIAESEIPDVSQEVFLTVHKKLPEFEGRANLRTWLYAICLRVASDHRRRAYVRREQPSAEPFADRQAQNGPTEDTRLEQRATLRALLTLLDPDKRDVLVLYEIEGFTMKEVAEILNCPLQTAYSRLHAARARLLEAFLAEQGTRQ